MCLAIPAKVIAINEDDMGVVDVSGIKKEVYLGLIGDIKIGEYVILLPIC